MIHLFYHYIYQDVYQLVWTNWAAGVVAAPIAFFWGKTFEKRAVLRHQDLKRHITKEHEKSRLHLETHLKRR